ncbi:hypothetical protein SAMN06297358_1125 [Pedobacter xixiisoli]|uniref:Lipoprotein n=1 Tax=Pedobacter xixiisoli TaxID=1476464 RepID=A0A285ZUJ5_9SPHI|nr:hypothetical protein SAMN06297358_1125 [Pedobacter xixiisoli]
MKTAKLLIVLIGFTFMSTGCRHDHKSKSSKTEKSNDSLEIDKEAKKNHRH